MARAIENEGYDISICAPLNDMSGAGAAIGSFDGTQELRLVRHRIDGVRAKDVVGLEGGPGRCVMAGHLGALGEPTQIVVAGINPGVNTGRAVLYSGTVGAALTAANLGGVGLAVSLGWNDDGEYHWDTAARIAVRCLPWLCALPPVASINLNVPNLPYEQVRGIRIAELAPFGAVRSALRPDGDDSFIFDYVAVTEPMPEGSDTALIAEGFAAVTALKLVHATESPPGMVEAFQG